MREQYMQSGQGFILVYQIISAQSLDALREIRDKIYAVKQKPVCDVEYFVACRLCRFFFQDTCIIPMIVVGNKCDLEEERVVMKEDGKKFADKINAGFIECSAKNNLNIKDIFVEIVRRIDSSEFRSQPPKKKFCTIL